MTNRREGTQPYIPRLTYRNSPSTASISDHSIKTIGTQSSAASISTGTTSPPSSLIGSIRSYQFSEDIPSPLSLDGTSDPLPSSTSLSPHAAKEPKKKSSSVFKFFSVKEPSTQAFEAYQEQMKKRGTTQSGRANPVGLPGVSSAKLPPTVPKVNSKWDGVPQAAKQKVREKNNPSQQSFASSASRPLYTSRSTGSNVTTMTTSSTSSTRSDIRANGKLKLDDGSANLADLYGWEVPSTSTSSGSSTRNFPLESRGSATSRPTLQRERTSFFPQSPSVLPTAYESPVETPPPLDASSNRSSPLILPSLPSPPTPKDSIPALPWSPALTSPCSNMPVKDDAVPSEGPVILSSSGTNVLGPPVSAARRPGSVPFAAGGVTEVTFPSDATSRPPTALPHPILKRPSEAPNQVWPPPPAPTEIEQSSWRRTLKVSSPARRDKAPSGSAEKVEAPSAPATATKLKRMQVMNIFSKDT
ncbi:MAG: hypothetical protein Q9166_003625 [cf. Caloplaca sp. 2 TL-2023]